jgi:hypothetical protein
LRLCSLVRSTRFENHGDKIVRVFFLAAFIIAAAPNSNAATDPATDDIRLELSPRICSLSGGEKQCETRINATWQAARKESLCLVILDRPEVKRCWEDYSQGTYSIHLVFSEDVVFQLKDPDLQHVLVSEALRVIREAILYRHKRRAPWNIFD